MCEVFRKLVPLTLQNKFSFSSSKEYKNNLYFMFEKPRRKQYSIAIKDVSLWNSLHNLVNCFHHGEFLRIIKKKGFYVNMDFLQNT